MMAALAIARDVNTGSKQGHRHMEFLDLTFGAALAVALLLTLGLFAWRGRRAASRGKPRGKPRPEALDTVAGWPPEAARVMTTREREAYELIRRALPGFLVLAQVPLSRFVRVPPRHSYSDWMQRVGQLSADLLICDAASRVLAVVDIRSTAETDRAKRRHERQARVLRAAGIRVHTWMDAGLPSVNEVRSTLGASLAGGAAAAAGAAAAVEEARGPVSGSAPLIPVAEIAEILAEGDEMDHSMEPVPSAFFDDMEPAGAR
jgi:hypothetical protein